MNKQEFLIGKPKVYPDKLANALKELFEKIPAVNLAYMAQIFIPNSGLPPHPVVGIDIEGNINDITDRLEEVIKNNTMQNEYVDIVPSNTKGLNEYFVTIEPFYKRTK